jgi:hypothetical protein
VIPPSAEMRNRQTVLHFREHTENHRGEAETVGRMIDSLKPQDISLQLSETRRMRTGVVLVQHNVRQLNIRPLLPEHVYTSQLLKN